MSSHSTKYMVSNNASNTLATDPSSTFSDNLYSLQWYYDGSVNVNINEAWDYYRGDGITVAVIDDGFDYNHEDLSANYDQSIDSDLLGGDDDAFYGSGDRHGTVVAGVIAADDNGVGTVGIAPDSTIMGLRVGFGSSGSISQFNNAFNEVLNNADIVNNSWGYTNSFDDNFNSSFFSTTASIIKTLADDGRAGLGTNIVFAAGNTKEDGQSANYHNHSNSPYTITVGAIQSDGHFSEFSSPGASVLVSAPGSSVATTDNTGADGYTNTDYAYAFGTSFAAPLVSGVVALMLDANPNLGWRDVQDILAVSAVQTGNNIDDGTIETYFYTGSENWNGGGMHFSNQYGYGLVDVTSAVKLSETWQLQSTSANRAQLTGTNNSDVRITDLGTVSSSIKITGDLQIEHAQIAVNLTHGHLGDLEIYLIAPDGTRSQIMDNPDNGSNSSTSLNFTLSSEAFRGMDASGNWKLEIVDTQATDAGLLNSWSLILSGKSGTKDDQFIFTDEYSTIAHQNGRTYLVENDGGTDTINAAAVSSSSLIDLASGYRIDGVYLGVSHPDSIENAIAGWADDILYGNAVDNVLTGNRGNDYLNGRAGNDTLNGGDGNDSLEGGAGNDTLNGGAGNDSILDVDGNNIVNAGSGDDYVFVANGNNTVNAGAGNDAITTGTGDDIVNGDEGNDTIDTGAGDDIVNGGDGDDNIYGRAGVNALYGGAGNDVLISEDSDDTIEGGSGNDTVIGGGGIDIIKGDEGEDILYGYDGDDIIHGGDDYDRIIGGSGADTIYADGGDDYVYGDVGTDIIYGGLGNDTLATAEGDDTAYGEDGNDVISGGSGQNKLYGDADNDSLFGYGGDDIIEGGTGDDYLFGGDGNDTLDGGDGNDYIQAGDGVDIIIGGSGMDRIFGEADNDTIDGGSGNDVISGGSGEDIINGGIGNDYVSGGDDNDTITDYRGGNVLVGGAGDDSLYFTSTSNILEGGTGADAFILSFLTDVNEAYSGNASTILDFSLSADLFDISNILSGFDALNDSINDFVTIGEEAGQSVISVRNDTSDAFSSILFADNDPFAGLSAQDLIDNGNLVV